MSIQFPDAPLTWYPGVDGVVAIWLYDSEKDEPVIQYNFGLYVSLRADDQITLNSK